MKILLKHEALLFTILVILTSAIISFISYQLNDTNISILVVLTPSLIALTITLFAEGKNGIFKLFIEQTTKRFGVKWLLISLFGIPLIAIAANLTVLKFNYNELSLRTTQIFPQIVVILLIALGEEYGWRAFLLPRLLKKYNLFISSLILGLVWGCWHIPGYFIGVGVPLQMNILVFLFWTILATIFIGWIYLKTNSVLTSIIIHISANASFNYLFLLPEFTGSMQNFYFFVIYLFIAISILIYIRKEEFFTIS